MLFAFTVEDDFAELGARRTKVKFVSGPAWDMQQKHYSRKANIGMDDRISYVHPQEFGDEHHIVALKGKKVVGVAVLQPNPSKSSEMWLKGVSVDKEHRGQGIGRSLVTEAKGEASKRGMTTKASSFTIDGKAKLKRYFPETSSLDDEFEELSATKKKATTKKKAPKKAAVKKPRKPAAKKPAFKKMTIKKAPVKKRKESVKRAISHADLIKAMSLSHALLSIMGAKGNHNTHDAFNIIDVYSKDESINDNMASVIRNTYTTAISILGRENPAYATLVDRPSFKVQPFTSKEAAFEQLKLDVQVTSDTIDSSRDKTASGAIKKRGAARKAVVTVPANLEPNHIFGKDGLADDLHDLYDQILSASQVKRNRTNKMQSVLKGLSNNSDYSKKDLWAILGALEYPKKIGTLKASMKKADIVKRFMDVNAPKGSSK